MPTGPRVVMGGPQKAPQVPTLVCGSGSPGPAFRPFLGTRPCAQESSCLLLLFKARGAPPDFLPRSEPTAGRSQEAGAALPGMQERRAFPGDPKPAGTPEAAAPGLQGLLPAPWRETPVSSAMVWEAAAPVCRGFYPLHGGRCPCLQPWFGRLQQHPGAQGSCLFPTSESTEAVSTALIGAAGAAPEGSGLLPAPGSHRLRGASAPSAPPCSLGRGS